MKHIKLQCRTAGFSYGEIVEIGTKKDQIKQEIAKSLVNGGQAIEYKEPVSSGSAELAKQVKTLTTEKDDSVKQAEALTTEKDDLAKQVEALTTEKDDLAKQVEALTTEKAALEEKIKAAKK